MMRSTLRLAACSAYGGKVQLIDYDGLYVDSLKGAKATELGQLNFQHPQRSAKDFGPTLHRFSFLTLDVALQVLISAPSMWASTRSEPSAVVFRRNDFLDPAQSASFQGAVAIPGVKAYVENLAKVAAEAFSAVPSLGDFLLGKGVPAGPIVIRSVPQVLEYQGPYVVADAANYAQVLQMVGTRVELVGRVHQVTHQRTKSGKPFIFVNFADWRGLAVKPSIWSEGIDAIRPNLPDKSLVGRWLSVSGLIDPPFSKGSRSGGYTHLSITISTPGQIQTPAEKDAKSRLQVAGKAVGGASVTAAGRNADILKEMGGRATRPKVAAVMQPPPAQPQSRNQSILGSMQRQSPAAGPAPPRQSPIPTKPQLGATSSNWVCWPVVLIAVFFLLALRACVA